MLIFVVVVNENMHHYSATEKGEQIVFLPLFLSEQGQKCINEQLVCRDTPPQFKKE